MTKNRQAMTVLKCMKRLKTERDTDNRPTSLCDVYASILQYHSPVIIQFLSAEFQASVQAFGADAIIKRHRVHKASGTLQ